MKRQLILIAVLLILMFTSGCGSSTRIEAEGASGQQQRNFRNGIDFDQQAPEANIRRALLGIIRVQSSDSPFTSEQAEKLIPLLEEIRAKETVDKEYGDEKVEEINGILTEGQKEPLTQGANNGIRMRGGQRDEAGIPPNPEPPNERRGGFDLKELCDRAIEALNK